MYSISFIEDGDTYWVRLNNSQRYGLFAAPAGKKKKHIKWKIHCRWRMKTINEINKILWLRENKLGNISAALETGYCYFWDYSGGEQEEEHCVQVMLPRLSCVVQGFAAETELIRGQGSCEGVSTWALLPVVMHCLHPDAQFAWGPNAYSQRLSCFSDINLMRRSKKHQHQHATELQELEQVASRNLLHLFSRNIWFNRTKNK